MENQEKKTKQTGRKTDKNPKTVEELFVGEYLEFKAESKRLADNLHEKEEEIDRLQKRVSELEGFIYSLTMRKEKSYYSGDPYIYVENQSFYSSDRNYELAMNIFDSRPSTEEVEK